MRIMLKARIPVETGNAAAREGRLGDKIQSILSNLKPENAYFTDDCGERTAYLFLNINHSSEIPRICEPWFLSFNARVELHPVMTPDDLNKAVPVISEAVKTFGC
ncbi:hypothetical protein HYY75_03835 [bacterium]|nr:hypothetical protein [bacterium]